MFDCPKIDRDKETSPTAPQLTRVVGTSHPLVFLMAEYFMEELSPEPKRAEDFAEMEYLSDADEPPADYVCWEATFDDEPDHSPAPFYKTHKREVDERGNVKLREICVPSKECKAKHLEFLDYLRGLGIPMPHSACGGSRSVYLDDGIYPHAEHGSQYFYKLDLHAAFSSVPVEHLLEVLDRFVPEHERGYVKEFMEQWGTTPLVPGLPQGAPSSGELINIYLATLGDAELAAYCDPRGIVSTRYMDDYLFSSANEIGKTKRLVIRKIIESQPGMQISHHKSKYHNLANGPVTFAGMSLYPDGRIQPKPSTLDKARLAYLDATAGVIRPEQQDYSALEIIDHYQSLVAGYHGAVNASITLDKQEREYTPAIRKLNQLHGKAVMAVAEARQKYTEHQRAEAYQRAIEAGRRRVQLGNYDLR